MASADQEAHAALVKACEQSDELRAAVDERSSPHGSTPAWLIEWEDPPEAVQRIQAVVRANTERLRELISERGWPGRSSVGDEGARAAWLIAHHADDLNLQRTAVDLLKRATESGDADIAQLELEDRVLLREGKPEKYGTHSGCRGDPPMPRLP